MRKWISLFMVLILGLAVVPSVNAYKGQLTVALGAETPTMDPHPQSNFVGLILWRWAYGTLVSAEAGTGKRLPWLAVKWKIHNPKKVEFWLRKGVKFIDGTPLTSEAVRYSMSRIMDKKSRQRVFFKDFDRIEIIDKHNFIWHSKKPDNGLLNRLSRYGLIMSPNTKKMDSATLSRNTFGSGPYVLKEWDRGRKMVFEANPNWWGNDEYPNRPKTVVVRSIREPTTRVKALLKGELDIIRGVLPQYIPQIEKKAGLDVDSQPAYRIQYLTFATRAGGPFTDRKVRLAVNYAIDAESMRRTFLGGRGDIWGSLFHPWNYSGYNPNDKWYGYDLAKAKSIMRESGYPGGFKAELFATSGRYPADRKTCEAIAGMLKEIKIDMTCRAMPYSLMRKIRKAYQNKRRTSPAMFLLAYGNTTGDPANVSRSTSTCKGHSSLHCYKDVEEVIERAAHTADTKLQHKRFQEVTAMQKKKVMFKILWKIHDVYSYKKSLGFKMRHDETFFPWEINMK